MNSKQMLFLRSVVPAAQASQRATGVPASITIAQAILESGWGQSSLATEANNYFGVKATALATPDEYAEFPTREFVSGTDVKVMAKFARYISPADSFTAHARLLSTVSRYKPAMARKNDSAAFCWALGPNTAVECLMCGKVFEGALCECGSEERNLIRHTEGCGYSTNPNYARILLGLIHQFDLTQYDVAPLQQASPPGNLNA
jgi:flagellum-specific peptidoglycan hydrolase FlgJ